MAAWPKPAPRPTPGWAFLRPSSSRDSACAESHAALATESGEGSRSARRQGPAARDRGCPRACAQTQRGDVVRLTDVEPPEFRLRVGDWRVRFRIDRAAATLILLRVLPRDQAYRRG